MSFHQYRINELYSNASGSIQFIEMKVGNFSGESQWSGVTLTSTRDGVQHSFVFPSNLPNTNTANTTVLITTQGFADVALVTPDFVVPDGFLFTAGGSLNFGNVDTITYGALAGGGALSVDRIGVQATATPKNFSGVSGTLPVPPTTELVIITGTAGDDTLTGTANTETIDGLAGNDTLRTGGGNDTLRGGAGDDQIHSGTGNNIIDGGEGYDHLYFGEATSGVSINMATGTAAGGSGSDTITGIELVFGSSFNDTFVGNDSPVGFLGGDGNDTITGGAGRDHLEGNGGDDTIDGKDGVDAVAYYSAAGAVTVNLTAGSATGGLGNDTLINIEDVVGSVFGDTLTGNSSNNELEGSDGNDTLVSTAGGDTLNGGNGVDAATYSQARSVFTLQRSTAGVYSIEKPNSTGSDTFTNTERLKFSDVGVALDVAANQTAGQTALLIGAVLGQAALAAKKPLVTSVLALMDEGFSFEVLSGAVMRLDIWGLLANDGNPGASNTQIASYLLKTVNGVAPDAATLAAAVTALDAQTGAAQGQFLFGLAASAANQQQVNLVGLAATGLEFAL
jgi:Ca2+-binding RTX toxin-like protein